MEYEIYHTNLPICSITLYWISSFMDLLLQYFNEYSLEGSLEENPQAVKLLENGLYINEVDNYLVI